MMEIKQLILTLSVIMLKLLCKINTLEILHNSLVPYPLMDRGEGLWMIPTWGTPTTG